MALGTMEHTGAGALSLCPFHGIWQGTGLCPLRARPACEGSDSVSGSEGLVTVSPGAGQRLVPTCLWVTSASVWLCQCMAVGLAGHPGMDAALASLLA